MLRDRSVLLVQRPSATTTPRNGSKSAFRGAGTASARCRPLTGVSPSSAIFRSASSSSAAKGTNTKRSSPFSRRAKLTILKEAARTLNYLTENNLLQYADLEKKVEDIHSSYARTGSELKNVEAKLREVQPLIKNISNYQRLKPVYDAYMKAADKPAYRAKHEAELVIYEAAKSTLLAIQGDGKLPSLKSLQAEQQRLVDEQQRLYDERAKLA